MNRSDPNFASSSFDFETEGQAGSLRDVVLIAFIDNPKAVVP